VICSCHLEEGEAMLPPPFDQVVSHGFLWTLMICLMISPGLPQILGVVFCSYWPPIDPREDQFWAYVPGDIFLALFVAGTSAFFDHGRFRIHWSILVAVAAVMLVVYAGLTFMDRQVYTKTQMRSANKVYHNLLYFWYGSIAIICFIGMWWGAPGSLYKKLAVTLFGLVWVGCLVKDNLTPLEALDVKFRFAHANNLPLWKTGWKIRRRTSEGYALAA
jgi:hypothetical protein